MEVTDKFWNCYKTTWDEFMEKYFLYRETKKIYLTQTNDKMAHFKKFIGSDNRVYKEWPPADARRTADAMEVGGSDFDH